MRGRRLSLIPLVFLALALASAAHGITFVVDRTDDNVASPADACTPLPNDCMLRGAIERSNADPGPDVVYVPQPVPFAQYITLAEIPITASVTIRGDGAGDCTTRGTCIMNVTMVSERIFIIDAADLAVFIRDLTLRDGFETGGGGAVRITGNCDGCVVTIQRARLHNNTVTGSTGGGGAIRILDCNPPATLKVLESSICSNKAVRDGGAIENIDSGATIEIESSTFDDNESEDRRGGAIRSDAADVTMTIENTTFSKNRASDTGGAIRFGGNGSILTLNNVTITENEAGTDGSGNGGGIILNGGTVNSSNTIIAGNTTPGQGPDCFDGGQTFTSLGCNLIGSIPNATVCNGFDQPTDKVNVDAMLGPLTDGRTPNSKGHVPRSDSPAIDMGGLAGCTPCLERDQRGVRRPQGGGCDIGAIEALPPKPAPLLSGAMLVAISILLLAAGVLVLRRKAD